MDHSTSKSVEIAQFSQNDYEDELRKQKIVPIRELGRGSFGCVYLAFDLNYGLIAAKIIQKDKYDEKEVDAAKILRMDIKCDNILLHSPLGSGRVYVKITDLGFTKKEGQTNEQTYLKGTLAFMSPELFQDQRIVTQKVDIYAIGITFYALILHKYPIFEGNYNAQRKKMFRMLSIERPPEIKNNNLWNLLSKLLEFDPILRITAKEALQLPFFTSTEALDDISTQQKELVQQAISAELNGDKIISEFDKDPSYTVSQQEILKFISDQIHYTKQE
ncbi:MAG: hypothetical protein EZS28_037536, partial [Streblomastix strix]